MLVIACDGSNWIGQSTGNPSGLAVASGYTRISQNFCSRDATSAVALVRDTNTTISAPSSNAKAVLIQLRVTAVSANSALERYTRIKIFQTSSFANTVSYSTAYAYESSTFPGSSGVYLSQSDGAYIAPVVSGDFFLAFDDDAGNQGVATYSILGYYD